MASAFLPAQALAIGPTGVVKPGFARFTVGASYTDGTTAIYLQGLRFDVSNRGRLPLDKYVAALTAERIALCGGKKTISQLAHEHGLSEKYLTLLWATLQNSKQQHDNPRSTKPSILLDTIRAKWNAGSDVSDDIIAWQNLLWQFSVVGHIGMSDGSQSWQVPAMPVASSIELRLPLESPADGMDVEFYLVAGNVGDGNSKCFVSWENPRLVSAAWPVRPLREAYALMHPAMIF